jgi:hypothetical protein
LQDGPRIVLHVMPGAAFDPATRLDLSAIKEPSLKLQPISASGWSHRFNLDGLLWFTEWREATPSPNYTQLFRNGMIEAVTVGLLREWEGKKIIASVVYEQELIVALDKYLTALKSCGLTPPIVVMLTILGAKGYSMAAGSNYWGGGMIDRDMLILPEVVVEELSTNAASVFKPIFDTFWQAAGWEKSLNYDKNGNWKAHA